MVVGVRPPMLTFEQSSPVPAGTDWAARLFFNKSQVCGFSSFESLVIGPVVSQGDLPDLEYELYRHGCAAFADWPRPLPVFGL